MNNLRATEKAANAIKTVPKESAQNFFTDQLPPVLRVAPNERFRIEAPSLLTFYPDGRLPASYDMIKIPVSGPVYIEGAHPGSTVEVTIESIELPTGRGVALTLPGIGVLGGEAKDFDSKVVTYDDRRVYFGHGLSVPVRKMVGKIGTAPRQPVSSSAPGPHGGNLDNTHITEGSVVYLPVTVEGALLYVGDLHAAQGDGEPFSGVESEGAVVLRVAVRADLAISDPVIVTSEAMVTSGAAPTIEEAVRIATHNAIVLLRDYLGLSHAEACMLCSIGCDIRLSQVMNPLMGAKVVIPRDLFVSSSLWKRDWERPPARSDVRPHGA